MEHGGAPLAHSEHPPNTTQKQKQKQKQRAASGKGSRRICSSGVDFGPVEMRIYLTAKTGSNHFSYLSGAVVSKGKERSRLFLFVLFSSREPSRKKKTCQAMHLSGARFLPAVNLPSRF